MSLWEDLGDFLGAAGETTAGGIGLSWDLATAPFIPPALRGPVQDPRQQTGDIWDDATRTYRSAKDPAMTALKGVFSIPGVKQAAETQYWLYSNVVSQPVSTVSMFLSDQSTTQWDLSASWSAAENISPGQALIANSAGPLQDLAWNVADPGQRSWLQENMPWINPNFDITQEDDREAAFTDSAIGKWQSGLADTALSWYGDPFRGAGKLASRGYNAATTTTIKTQDDLLGLYEDARKHQEFLTSGGQSGQRTGFGQLVEDSTTMTPSQLLFDRRVQASSRPELLASLLGNSDDYARNALIIRGASGDISALNALRAADASTWDAIQTASKNLEVTQARILERVGGREKLLDDDGNLIHDWDYDNLPGLADDVDLYKTYKDVHDDLIAKDEWLAKTIELASQPSITALKTKGASVSVLRGQAARARADRKMTKTGFWSDQTVSGYGKRAVRVISWLGDESPSGWVNIKGSSANNSTREIVAALSKVKTWGDEAGAAKKQYWVDQYIDATSQADRMDVLLRMEKDVLYDVGRKMLGEGDDVASNEAVRAFIDNVYDQHHRARTRAATHLSQRSFMVDADGTLIKAPQFEAQLADSVPMADFRMYEDLLGRHGSALKETLGLGKDALANGYDLFASVWRPLTLLRLGYTIRNVGEGELRTMAYFNGMMNIDPLILGRNSAAFRAGANLNARMTSAQMRVFGGRKRKSELLDEAAVLRAARVNREKELADLVDDEAVLVRSHKQAAGPAAMPRDDYYAGMVDPLQPALQPRQVAYRDVEVGIASPSKSLLGSRERTRYFALKERGENLTNAERAELVALARKAVARHANEQRKAGYRLAYRDADGAMKYANKVSEIPDSAFDPILAARAQRKLDDRNVRRVSRDEEPVVAPLQDPEIHLVPDHQRLVKEAQGRTELVPERVLGDYPRLAKHNPEDEYVYRASDEILQSREAIRREMEEIDAQLEYLRVQASYLARNRRWRGRKEDAADAPPPPDEIRRGGTGTFEYGGYDLPDSFEGRAGRAGQVASSADARRELEMFGPSSRIHGRADTRGAWIAVKPTDPSYWDSLARVVNRQFRFSPFVMRLLKGDDPAEVASELARTRAGRQVLKGIGVDPEDAYLHVQRVADMINRYIPDPAVRAAAAGGDISALELKASLAGRADLAPVHGVEVGKATNVGNYTGQLRDSATRKGFQLLGSIPEDVATRHPFYRRVYQQELKRTITLRKTQGVDLTQADLDDLITAAHARALRETKATLYTIERYSNAAAKMRFFMPFFASWENSMRTWAGLAKNNGSVVPSILMLTQAPNRMGWVTDQNGNTVGVGEGGGDVDEYLTVQLGTKALPDWMATGVDSMNQMAIPKQSLNLVMQGEPWYFPGLGPVGQIPLSELAKRKPSLGQVMQDMKLIPFGPSEKFASWDMAAPAWMKRVFSLLQGESDVTYANSMSMIMATERMRYRLGERDTEPTMAEVEDRTNKLFGVRMLANLTLPFAPNFQSPFQMYFDEYRRMKSEDPENADAQFLDRYPEYYEAMMSLSKNPTGAWATVDTAERSKKYSSLVAELGELDPSLVALVVNNGAYDPNDFSDSAQAFQYTHTLGPGSTQKFRETQSPEAAVKAVDIKKGWTEYMQLMNMVGAIMEDRGLTSLQQTGAEDLAFVVGQWREQQAETNSAWWYDYNERDAGQYAKNVSALQSIVSNETFMADAGDDPKWLAVESYLDTRTMFQAELQRRDLAGGSADINAIANQDLKFVWSQFTGELVQGSTEFADIYTRYLENDTLGVVPNG